MIIQIYGNNVPQDFWAVGVSHIRQVHQDYIYIE